MATELVLIVRDVSIFFALHLKSYASNLNIASCAGEQQCGHVSYFQGLPGPCPLMKYFGVSVSTSNVCLILSCEWLPH